MNIFIQKLTFILDWLFDSLIRPLFTLIGSGLELIFLKPLELFHVPIFYQIVLAAMATALLSRFIRGCLKVEDKEQLFKEKFSAQRLQQKNIDLLEDWKMRDSLYRHTDKEIDEDFNTYLAQRFSRYMQVYMIPLFLSLYWMNTVFSVDELTSRLGSPYLIDLTERGWTMQGANVSVVFLVAYVISLIGYHYGAKKFQRHEPNPKMHTDILTSN
jgi:uncharacterized membrane protein (DUF106 family)